MVARNTGKEALSQEDFENWDSGKRVKKEPPKVQDDPKRPKVADIIPLGKIKPEDVKGAPSGRIKTIRNEDGVMFTGYNVTLQLKDGKTVTGWMEDGLYLELRRLLSFEDSVNTVNME